MKTDAEIAETEIINSFQLFTEFVEAKAAGDVPLLRTVLAEVEGVAMHTTQPRLRARCQALLEEHKDHLGTPPTIFE